ncbi:unnamed protein product, partial [Nesidiocoris tenuis]
MNFLNPVTERWYLIRVSKFACHVSRILAALPALQQIFAIERSSLWMYCVVTGHL